MNKHTLKPFIKWAGGKKQLLSQIAKKYPAELGRRINKYAEPFVGGGSVLFDLLDKYKLEDVYISDINAELIHTYKTVRDDVKALIEALLSYQSQYLALTDEKRKDYYYSKRTRFNDLKCSSVLNTEIAALFIFLNHTCFNGLYRVNSKGEFNVPIGSYKKPKICDEQNLRMVSAALADVKITCADFENSENFIDENTFAYFDPPYRPLNATSNFTAYAKTDFNDSEQQRLAEYIKRLSQKNAYIIASNSDPKNADPNDTYFDELYNHMTVSRVYASRFINSKGSRRGKISELLIYSN